MRGLDGRHLRGTVAADLLEAVRRGGELDPALVPAPPADDLDRSLRPAVALATAWVAQLARDLRIDASLLATRADLQALLRGDPDARLSRGWRADLVGQHVRRLVLGEEALAFDGRGGLVLEARSRRPVGPAVAVPSVAWTDEGAGAPLADATAELAERAAELADTADGQ